MTLVQYDRVQETSTTTGTGTYTLAGAVLGYQSFAAVGNANTCYYCAMGVDGNGNPNGDGWEVGLGTYTAAGTTLARTTVLASSNGGAAVNWAAGTRRIFVTIPAGGAPPFSLTNATGLPLSTGVTGILGGTNGGGLVRIGAPVVTSGSQTTIDFSSIPATYNALLLVLQTQDTAAGTSSSQLRAMLNGDATAGNYSVSQRGGGINSAANGSQVAASAKGLYIGNQPNAGNTSMAGQCELLIANYASTTWHKRIRSLFVSDDGTNSGIAFIIHGRWKSTAAVNQVTIGTDGTAFTDGSIATLYGMN